MSDPNHPAKIVIVIRGGLVDAIFTDKPMDSRFFIADYDHPMTYPTESKSGMVDWQGIDRVLIEDTAMLDTAAVRNIINKRGTQ
jgi:hypothetical protein